MDKFEEPKAQLNYKLWKNKWPEDHLALTYYHHDEKFPIGFINGGPIPLSDGIKVAKDTFGNRIGPIIHLALAPHPEHNVVHILSKTPTESETLFGDGVIVPRIGNFSIGGFIADCAIGIVASEKYIGYFHAGKPEIISNPSLVENFFRKWPDSPSDTWIFIGPMIEGKHYEISKLDSRWNQYIVKTDWGTRGFDVRAALYDQLPEVPADQIIISKIDPFTEMEKYGEQSPILSDQWYKHYKNEPNKDQTVFCPRNFALFTYKQD